MEDKSDEMGARSRARELRSRGFEEVIRRCVGDVDLDVRERARGCVDVWERLLGEGRGASESRSLSGSGDGAGGGVSGVASGRAGRVWER